MPYLMSGLLIIVMLLALGASLGIVGLEIAISRQKNMINVAMKAMTGFSCVVLAFVLLGHGLISGYSWRSILENWELALPDTRRTETMLILLYHIPMLLGVTAMLSAAAAERMRYQHWIAICLVMGGILWPVMTNLLWDGWGQQHSVGSLVVMGFVDQGRVGAVFSTAGWIALALVMVLGPRRGFRFAGRKPLKVAPASLPANLRYPGMAALSIFGVGLGLTALLISTHLHLFLLDPQGSLRLENLGNLMLRSVTNTLLSATVAIATGVLTRELFCKPLSILQVMIGSLFGGIMAVACNIADYQVANVAIIAGIGGALSVLGQSLFQRWQIDDASGLVAPAVIAGSWGMLAVALFPPIDGFAVDRDWARQLLLQLQALIAISGSAFGGSLVLFRGMDWALGLRVSVEDEQVGINLPDAGVDVPTIGLIQQMVNQKLTDDYSNPIEVDPESDVAIAARIYNNVLERLHIETVRRQIAALRLAQLANYDSLTGLANRRLFHDLIQRSMGRSHRSSRNGALLVLDLDQFKAINDKHGHTVGDGVLVQISQRIADSIRETDALARLAGDQFGVLLEDLTSPETPKIVAAKIIDAVTRPVPVAGNPERLSLSIGIVVFGAGQIDSVETILRKAETALRQAKTSGRGVVRYYDPLQDGSVFTASARPV